jgi:hypothetical protein
MRITSRLDQHSAVTGLSTPQSVDSHVHVVEPVAPVTVVSAWVSPIVVVIALCIIVSLLVLADAAAFLAHDALVRHDMPWVQRVFDLNHEKNVSTWYQSLTLFAGAALALCSAFAARAEGNPNRSWLGIAAMLLYLSIDEAAAIHEHAPRAILSAADAPLVGAVAVVSTGLALATAIAYIPFLTSLPALTRKLLLIAGGGYVIATLAIDQATGAVYDEQDSSATYAAVTTIEEIIEMLAVIVLLYALMRYLAGRGAQVRVQFTDQEERGVEPVASDR